MEGTGNLVVQALTASGALPVKDARVYIYSHAEDGAPARLLYTLVTDGDGRTAAIPLAAKPRSQSLSPPQAGDAPPYMSYTVQVVAQGYGEKTEERVPIYEGITSLQPMVLIPN